MLQNELNMLIYENRAYKNEIILVRRPFFRSFDFVNECYSGLKANNENSCNQFRWRVSHKIDFKAIWPHDAMPQA